LDVTGERSDVPRQLPVALAPAEAAFRVEHPGGTPAFVHLGVAPPLQVPGRVARDRDHALDAVGVREAGGEPAADTQPPHGEPVLEAFAQARRRIGPTRLELRGQVPTGTFTGKCPHVYFDWTEGNPVSHLLRFLIFGSGEVAP
jgi:hypothetical protein